jgi:hypothetical protein
MQSTGHASMASCIVCIVIYIGNYPNSYLYYNLYTACSDGLPRAVSEVSFLVHALKYLGTIEPTFQMLLSSKFRRPGALDRSRLTVEKPGRVRDPVP